VGRPGELSENLPQPHRAASFPKSPQWTVYIMEPSHYEVIPSHCAFYVLRYEGGRCQLIERFEDSEDARSYAALMTWLDAAPRRLASH
jgi:hypothetical protein